jgi:hypothetical protein
MIMDRTLKDIKPPSDPSAPAGATGTSKDPVGAMRAVTTNLTEIAFLVYNNPEWKYKQRIIATAKPFF